MGDGGLLLDDKDPGRVAAALKVLSEEPELRRRLVRAGRNNVLRFSRARSLHGLARFLRDRLDIQILVPATPPEPTVTDQPARWRVEGPFDSSYSLALVNRFLELHDGWVEIESGNGTLVRCHLPRRIQDGEPHPEQSTDRKTAYL